MGYELIDSVPTRLGTITSDIQLDADLDFVGAQSITTTAAALTIAPTTDTLFANGTGVVIGHTAQETISTDGSTDLVPELQVLGTTAADSSMMLAAFSATATIAGSPILAFAKSGDAAIDGTHVVVTDGEELGNIVAYGDDGTDLESIAAQIQFEVDGTPGTGDMPGRIVFATTADGAEAATERMKISANGTVSLPSTSGSNLSVANTTNATSGSTGSINTLGGLGVTLDIWCDGSIFAKKSASGATTTVQSRNVSTGVNSHAKLEASVASTTGDCMLSMGNTLTDWAGGVDNSNSDAWVIGPNGALGGNDALRISAATPPVITYNTTHPTGTFDYVCEVCGKHRAEPFTCHDQTAPWHDDVLALMSVAEDAGKGNGLTGLEPGVQHLAKLGVLDISTNNDGSPWIGMDAVSAQWYAYSGIVQNRRLIDAQYAEIDKRLKLAGV
jgi:hypothetical protein